RTTETTGLIQRSEVSLSACFRSLVNGDGCFDRLRLGGAERDRTDDLLLAKQALSQLSYSPFRFAPLCCSVPRVRPLYTSAPRASIGSRPAPAARSGGSGWIRTIDPRLIKTVL